MIRLRKVICMILSSLVLLTACGQQQDSGETVGFSAGEPSAGETSEAVASPSASESIPDSTEETGQPESGEEIVAANIYGESFFFSNRVMKFAKENPAYGMEYLAAYEGTEAERVLMDVANGKGPDILFLRGRDVDSLQAIGALGEIGRLISDENMDALLPGAVRMGTYEDKLYAIPLSVYVRSLLTRRDYWQEDSWTVEDILSVLEESNEIEGLFVDIGGADEYFYNMYFMIGMDIMHSPFLKDGNSGFDCQEFRDLLVTIKNMTHNAHNNWRPDDRLLPLTDGSYLGTECLFTTMKGFCDIYEKMGENANLAGYPSDMGSSHYLQEAGMLVVNQNAMEKEGVRELVNDLLGLESQKHVGYAISVRKDIPEAQLMYDKSSNAYIWTASAGNGFLLPAKADGSSYLEEYLQLLQSAEPASFASDELFDMVMEEANGYFSSDKSLDEVVDLIQNRVQLYLDERK